MRNKLLPLTTTGDNVFVLPQPAALEMTWTISDDSRLQSYVFIHVISCLINVVREFISTLGVYPIYRYITIALNMESCQNTCYLCRRSYPISSSFPSLSIYRSESYQVNPHKMGTKERNKEANSKERGRMREDICAEVPRGPPGK